MCNHLGDLDFNSNPAMPGFAYLKSVPNAKSTRNDESIYGLNTCDFDGDFVGPFLKSYGRVAVPGEKPRGCGGCFATAA